MSQRNANPFLSVVVPAFNEEANLADTLQSILSWLSRQPFDSDVTVVDDGSADATTDIVSQIAAGDDRVRLLSYVPNRGKGYAVRHGMTQVSGRWRLFMDADNSTTIDQLDSVCPRLESGEFDILIGSRRVAGASIEIHQPRWKELFGDLGSLWIRSLAVSEIRDTQAGFKLFRGDIADRLFPVLTLDGWAFDIELLAAAQKNGFRIVEHPIRWVDEPHSKVTLRAYFRVLVDVLHIRRKVRRGDYDLSSQREQ